MRVLVTGGAGFIGSHITVALTDAGHEAIIADNFSNSDKSAIDRLKLLTGHDLEWHEVDLTSQLETDELFARGVFDAVIHCAGLKAVGESVTAPIPYYRNNIDSALSVLAAMRKHGVRRLVFSSSATVYSSDLHSPFAEDDGPLRATNPYGQTKVMIERILTDVAQASQGWKVALLRYFNPIGAHESGLIGEDPQDTPNNLMPYITQVAVGQLPSLTVHGADYGTADGTGERDYVHVVDLASGHLAALAHLDVMSDTVRAFNLGTGHATSVLELVSAFEQATGRRVPRTVGPRRDGDLAVAYADPSRAQAELGWSATRSIRQMCADAWRWQSNRHAADLQDPHIGVPSASVDSPLTTERTSTFLTSDSQESTTLVVNDGGLPVPAIAGSKARAVLFGTSRLHRPFARQQVGGPRLNYPDASEPIFMRMGYFHGATEIAQIVEALVGVREIPRAMMPFFFRMENKATTPQNEFDDDLLSAIRAGKDFATADPERIRQGQVVIAEISSLRTSWHRDTGTALHTNPNFLHNIPYSDIYPRGYYQMYAPWLNVEVIRENEESLTQGMRRIMRALPDARLMVLGHLASDQHPQGDRLVQNRVVAAAARRAGAYYFDLAPLVDTYGFAEVDGRTAITI